MRSPEDWIRGWPSDENTDPPAFTRANKLKFVAAIQRDALDMEPPPDGEHLAGYWRKLKEEHELMAVAISKSIDALSHVGMPMHGERRRCASRS